MVKKSSAGERVQITFSKDQLKLIREYKGMLGDNDPEVIRTIVINWLLERSEGKR
jgi:hypothetical protein